MSEYSRLPKSITIIDGTLREGLQNEEILVPTETKLFILESLIDAGFRIFEVGSFSPPAAMPQFRDSEEITKRMPRKSNIFYKINTFNMKLVERAIEAKKGGYGPDIINTQFATTEEFSQYFFRTTVANRWKFIEEALKVAHDAGLMFQLSIINTWYCPFKGEMPMEVSLEYTDKLIKMGCDIVRACDPTGFVTPPKAYEYFSRVLDKHPDPNNHTYHQHDHRCFGLSNYLAAMQAGCTRFDTSLGGTGGPTATIVGGIHPKGAVEYVHRPYKTGLVCTEDFVTMCDAMGIETGIDLDKVFRLGKWIERILERKLWSFCINHSRVPKGSQIIKGLEKEIG